MAQPEQLDMREFLSPWYTPQTTYAELARRIGENTVEVVYVVKDYHCDPDKNPNLVGEITSEGNVTTNTFIIDSVQPSHTEGHLKNMRLFPGHLADGTLIATVTHDRTRLWLVEFRTIAHSKPGVPGDKLMATTTLLKEESEARFIRGVVNCEDRVHTRAFDMKFVGGPDLPSNGFYLSQHQLFEIGAQAAGGIVKLLHPEVFEESEEERDPIFDSIGISTLEKIILRPGDKITSRVTLRRITNQGAFYVNIDMRRQDEPIATLGNLGIGFLSHNSIKAEIDKLQHV